MKMTPLKIVVIANAVIWGLTLIVDCLPIHNGAAKGGALMWPFILSMIDLVLGFICLIIMGLTKNSFGRALADSFMQGFMISFAIMLLVAVPTCFWAIGVR
ncbi:hypothetical protein AEAC466_03735 [Asticcacaulis sp. AC466]|uniref:hypothetical protein n=1 Tax=Asticcacaulis sp. AC466 TaxID=1282362 RepID=UPI0003C3E158|nr:hypothetical protein [Asticcacaulis sp. AC466]ESQ86321.1 hypothetical protein AEAC466_03735 [Asticcacaulis sp. AC466]